MKGVVDSNENTENNSYMELCCKVQLIVVVRQPLTLLFSAIAVLNELIKPAVRNLPNSKQAC